MSIKEATMGQLCSVRVKAKLAEDAAVTYRRQIDLEIADRLHTGELEGTVSEKPEGYKVSVSYKLNRTVDTDALAKAWSDLPQYAQGVFKWKAEVSVSELRRLEGRELAKVSEFFESKPAAPSVKVEVTQ